MRREPIKKALRSPGKQSRSAGRPTRGVLPRYVAIGDAKKVDESVELIPGRVIADYLKGELVGIEVIG